MSLRRSRISMNSFGLPLNSALPHFTLFVSLNLSLLRLGLGSLYRVWKKGYERIAALRPGGDEDGQKCLNDKVISM